MLKVTDSVNNVLCMSDVRVFYVSMSDDAPSIYVLN